MDNVINYQEVLTKKMDMTIKMQIKQSSQGIHVPEKLERQVTLLHEWYSNELRQLEVI